MTALPAIIPAAGILNESSINSTLLKILGFCFIALAIFVAIGGHKKKIGDAGSTLLIALICVVIAGLGFLLMTPFGQNVIQSIINT